MALRNSKRTKTLISNYAVLETRNLLATVTNEVFNDLNAIVIDGTNQDDSAIVSFADDANRQSIIVNLNGEDHAFDLDEEIERVVFYGRSGNDFFENLTDIDANAYGHLGNDRLRGGNGHNRFQGGAGNDIIVGGDRNDLLRGRTGNDEIYPGKRHDRVFGGPGNDFVQQSPGRDFIMGEAGNDTIFGGNGLDRISGGVGNNTIDFGSSNNDVALFDEAFHDYHVSLEQNQSLQVQLDSGGTSNTVIGADTLRFADSDRQAANFFVDLQPAEQRVLNLINDIRSDQNLDALIPVVDISSFTENWTEMVVSPLGVPTAQELLDNHSTSPMHLNGGQHPLFDMDPDRSEYREISGYFPPAGQSQAMRAIVNAWEGSEFHFDNLTQSQSIEVGIGVVETSDGWFVTVGIGSVA